SFIFQALGCLTPLILKGSAKSPKSAEWMCSALYELFKALSVPMNMTDSLGISHIINDLNIIDPSIFDAVPVFNSTFKRATNTYSGKAIATLLGLQEDETFTLDNLVRLFITIIAYDPGSLRAEQFVHLLQYLIPHFLHESSSVRTLVDDGMTALTEVFLKFTKSSKPLIAGTGFSGSGMIYINQEEDVDSTDDAINDVQLITEATTQAFGKNWKQNDRMTIKRQFLTLVQVYRQHNGMLSDSCHDKIAQIIRMMIKDYAAIKMRVSTNFLKNYIKNALLYNTTFEDGRKPIMALLRQVSHAFRQHYKHIDFSGFIDGLVLIVNDKAEFAINDPVMADLLKEKFVSFGLHVVLKPDWEDSTETMQNRLCSSLINLFVAMMTYSTQDMLSELDKYPPSHTLMAYIVIPICLQYKEVAIFTPLAASFNQHEKNARIVWSRLLDYITKAFYKNKEICENEDENQNKTTSMMETTAIFILGFTALKILMVRANKYVTQSKGMWVYIAQFVRQILATVGTSQSGQWSGASTPRTSSTSIHIIAEPLETNMGSLTDDKPYLNLNNHTKSPSSATDFVLWTFIELILSYKLPINLYLRTFIHQKLQHSTIGKSSRPQTPNSPIIATNNRESKWRSWGGPPVGFQQALYRSLEKDSNTQGSNKDIIEPSGGGILSSNNGSQNDLNIIPQFNASVVQTIHSSHHNSLQNLVSETLNSYLNVRALMGYGNIRLSMHNSNNFSELRAWSYKQVLEKLKEERKLVIAAYKEVFKVSGSDGVTYHGTDV
ncbi:27818_t:CDS:1, partial [Racocetra persica]